MPRSLWWFVGLLAAWTAYLWVTRLFNAWSSADEATSTKVVSSLLSVVFLGFVAVAVVILARTWNGQIEGWMRTVLLAFAAWTAVVWVVRIASISVADHTMAFKVVHAALGVVSIVLAGLVAWGVVSGTSAPADETAVSTQQSGAR